jgi:TolB-like protein/Tfp pilus assembly protein PilF
VRVRADVPEWNRRQALVIAILFVLLLTALGAVLNVGGLRKGLLSGHRSPRIQSLAVLPLVSLSHDPEQDYFADGMTDELITNLAHIRELRVVSRTSVMHYKGTKKTLPEIARELNVDALVEGTVLREGKRVRISAQLVRGSADSHLWAKAYTRDLSDVLVLQEEMAREIAGEITINLSPREKAVLASARQVNPEAHELYLKGRCFWNKRTREALQKSLEYFQQAIEKDPNNALAYAGVADAYFVMGAYHILPVPKADAKAEAAAMKALQLDNTLAEAHTALANVRCNAWDYQGAEKEFKKAIELNPGYATAHQWYGAGPLVNFGRFDEAIAEVQKAESLDPLSLIISAQVGWVLFYARHYDQAIAQQKKTLEMDPDFAYAHNWLMNTYVAKGMFDEALAENAKTNGGKPERELTARVAALQGKPGEVIRLIQRMKGREKEFEDRGDGGFFVDWMAIHYSLIGEKDQALLYLEKGYRKHSEEIQYLKVEREFDPLRSDPRFRELERRAGLPE